MPSSNPKTDELMKQLENGVKEVFSSERFSEYLKFMSSFYNYSFRNVLLILMQNPNATMVAGYNDWKNKHKRQVLKGEKGLRILAPVPYKIKVDKPVFDEHGNPVIIDGKQITETTEVNKLRFKPVSVFDVSQTEGEPIPQLAPELNFQVKNYPELFAAISAISDYPISFENIPGRAHGYCDYSNQKIVIDTGMSEAQNIKTAIHEVAHSRLHSPDNNTQQRTKRTVAEVEAESVAYVVSNYFGIDTSDYSFDYIANWSSSFELKELSASLERIQKEANILIQGIEEQYKIILKNRDVEINHVEKGVDRDMDGIEDSKDSSYSDSKIAQTPQDVLETQNKTTPESNKIKYSKEENDRIIQEIKSSIPIQDYAQAIGFTVKQAGSYYTLKEHDSVRIDPRKNAFWRNSAGTKARGSIIDFVMHFEGLDKATAINKLASYIGANEQTTHHNLPKSPPIPSQEKKSTKLVLPQKGDKSMRNVYAYLIHTRKIDSEIVKQWVRNGNLYQDVNKNCVFVTYDKSGNPNFVSQKGTNTTRHFQADVENSDYNCCHFINNNAKTLIVCEAVIDLMSVQTILKANGRDLNNYNYLSLNGTGKTHAILNALQNSKTETVVLATDNDTAGAIARAELKELAGDFDKDIKFVDFIPKSEKDWNAELVANVQRELTNSHSKKTLSDKISECQDKANVQNKSIELNKQQNISQKRNSPDLS